MNVPAPVRAYIALGSNLGDSKRLVRDAMAALGQLPGTRLVASSGLYLTKPWGVTEQPSFVNAVAGVTTTLAPRALLEALLDTERVFGRVRDGERWGPRTLDLDLLLHGDRVLDEDGLSLPHPRLAERAFVLLPLAEIAPTLDIPGLGLVADLLARVDAGGCIAVS
ncbi:MAG TPA: 2-amino-4-hydroxy-6-hydroxymethyldihydropteridine diphosphokinase [Luteibacter sp.]|nr:2-amino-4-hydroxy-6-hydroxymethyldihydropteridine diphosphokinase [Luteibacter sp.]